MLIRRTLEKIDCVALFRVLFFMEMGKVYRRKGYYMARTIREILQTETIYIDEKIVEGGAKYYIDDNGNKQYLLPAPSEIRKRYNNDELLFRRSVPYVEGEGTREEYEDMVLRYFRPTEDD